MLMFMLRERDNNYFQPILRVGQQLSELHEGKEQAAFSRSDSFLIPARGQINGV